MKGANAPFIFFLTDHTERSTELTSKACFGIFNLKETLKPRLTSELAGSSGRLVFDTTNKDSDILQRRMSGMNSDTCNYSTYNTKPFKYSPSG